ncbi:MAG: hypothetical protein ACPGO3_06780 [Magnetospiraceae bacterium]
MRHALEGSQAIARAVALCRPGVVAAYPITPQTHIVENISKLVADGVLKTELVSVESEFSAASVVLGAASAGARAYTASSSQGILLMAEVLFNIAGLRVPMVLTCANRAVSAPLSIWNDHQDSMAVRDSGWIQLHCQSNQEAVDTTIQAYRIAEACELPVMVCLDGFVLTHTLEPIDLPDPKLVDKYLPPFTFSRALDPSDPTSVGTLVGPEYYAEVRHTQHVAMERAIDEIVAADVAWEKLTKRSCGGLLTTYGDASAKTAILAMGSTVGTLRAAMEVFPQRKKVKIINLRCFRPFPGAAIREACAGLADLIVLDRSMSPGMGGVLGCEVRAALAEGRSKTKVHNFAVGFGGRDIPLDIYPRILEAAKEGDGTGFSVFDAEMDKIPLEDR